jgi:hypothetical protein
MFGPYNLTPDNIDHYVRPCAPGVFMVGYTKENGAFVVRYVGRSDSDVRTELRRQPLDEMARFKWAETSSQMSAFDTQCELYHEFGADSLDNDEHPPRPKGSGWVCPICDVFER